MARPPAPIIAPVSGSPEQRLQAIADAITRNTVAISTVHNGVQDGSDAAPGEIGEFAYRAITTAVTLNSNGTVDLTSFTLPPGDFDVVGEAYFIASTSAGTDDLRVWVNTVSVTQPTGDQGGLAIMSTTSGGQINNLTCSPLRVLISVPTVYYLSASANFGSGNMQIKGFIRARRMR